MTKAARLQFFNELFDKLKDLQVCEKTLKEIRTFLEKQRDMKTAHSIQINYAEVEHPIFWNHTSKSTLLVNFFQKCLGCFTR